MQPLEIIGLRIIRLRVPRCLDLGAPPHSLSGSPYPFSGGGFPSKIDYRKAGPLFLTSLLEDLAFPGGKKQVQLPARWCA